MHPHRRDYGYLATTAERHPFATIALAIAIAGFTAASVFAGLAYSVTAPMPVNGSPKLMHRLTPHTAPLQPSAIAYRK